MNPRTRLLPVCLLAVSALPLLLPVRTFAHPVITEFLAGNDRGLYDADQQRRDWIEVSNLTAQSVALGDYWFTNDPLLPQKWALPARTLQAGERLVVFASEKNLAPPAGEVHSNFQLQNAGGYLALTGPAGYVQSFGAAYPAQVADVSYGLPENTAVTPLVTAASAAAVLVPQSAGELPADWKTVPFAAPTLTGAAVIGHEGAAVIPAGRIWQVTMDNADTGAGSGSDSSATAAFQVRDTQGTNHGTAGNAQTLGATLTSHVTSGAPGRLSEALRFDPAGSSDNRAINFGNVLSPGTGSFTVNLWINTTTTSGTQIIASKGNASSGAVGWSIFLENGVLFTRAGLSSSDRGSQRRAFATVNDWHMVTLVLDSSTGLITGYLDGSNAGWLSGGGGPAEGDNTITAEANLTNTSPLALGIRTSDWGIEYRGLMDDAAMWNRALSASEVAQVFASAPEGFSAGAGINTQAAMSGVNASAFVQIPFTISGTPDFTALILHMRSDDGYLAWINGQPVASRRAPVSPAWNSGAEPGDTAMVDETINLAAALPFLVSGTNMLAIQALNASAFDADFLCTPELTATAATTGAPVFFLSPTPGASNASTRISDPQALVTFTPDGSVFTTAQTVTLSSTAAGDIRYTLDGSTPTVASPLYSAPLNLTAGTEVRARVFQPGDGGGRVTAAGFIKLGADVQAFTSPLPVVIMENFDRGAIPNYRAANPPAGDGSGLRQAHRQPGSLALFAPAAGTTSLTSVPAVQSRLGMRVRGSSSAGAQPALKQNLSVETWGKFDENSANIAPPGLPNESDWVLYAPYNYDRAMVRNAVAYELMRRCGHWAPGTRFVEVFTNTGGGEVTMADFAGVFVLTESIKADNDRVDLKKLSEDAATGGWMVLADRMDALHEDGRATAPWNFHPAGPNRIKQGPYGGSAGTDQGGDDVPTGYNTFLNFAEPSGYNTTAAQRSAISGWFDDMENVLYGANWRDPADGWAAWLDRETWVDNYLLANLSRNVDDLQLSTHFYRKHEGDLLHLNPPWDYDRSMDSYDSRDDATTGQYGQSFLWYPRLFADPCFAQAVIDRWQALRRGLWSNAALTALIDGYAAEITEPVAAANFAKWNTAANTPRAGGWPAEITALKTWLTARANWIDSQYTAAPSFSVPGGEVTAGTSVSLTAPAGTIYYATGGSDPLLCDAAGLSVAPHAITYSGPLTVNASTILTARVFTGTAWSGPVTVSYTAGTVAAAAGNVLIAEIHYHPANPTASENHGGFYSDADFEFVELFNPAAQTVNLSSCQLAVDVQFTFPEGTLLAPGQRIVVVENAAAFRLRYGNGPVVAGEYSGNLSNAGNTLALLAAAGADIQRFTFDDLAPWPVTPDGEGPSLVLRSPEAFPDSMAAANWRPSFVLHGSPGSDDRPEFSAWAAVNGAGPALDDGDFDGLSSLVEFMLGGDPHTASLHRLPSTAFQTITVNDMPAEYATLSFTRLTEPARVTTVVQFSSNLTDWSLPAVRLTATEHPDGTTTEVWRSSDPVSAGQRLFGRVHFTMP